MIEQPKKERRFLKTLGRVGEIILEKVLIRLGSNLIKKIGGKKPLPSILFLLASFSLFAQYPNTGNKQRLGYQTTGDGLVFRGRSSDTTALKPSTINNAYFVLDTVNNVLYNYIKTKGGWVFNNADTVINNITIDTTSLSNRINLKLNISDTASMLTNYLRSGVAASTYTPLTRSISTTSPLQGGGDLSTNRTLSILSASDIQSGIVNTTAQLFSGSKVFKHRLTADSLFYLNNTTPIPTAILGIDLTGGVNSVGKFTLGNGLSIISSTLLADTNLLVTRFDTASMLTPYFRDSDTTSLNLTSRFAAKLNLSDTASMLTNYLRTGVAASTYLPLTGGTTSGLITSSFTNTSNYSTSATDNNAFIIYNNTTSSNNIYGGIQFLIGENSGAIPGGPGLAQIYGIRAGGTSNPSTDLTFLTKSSISGVLEKMRIKFDGKVGIGTTAPSYLLDVNGTFNATGASLIGSTLGVTGATTLSSPLTVNSSAVFNEGSTDSDFRVESDGNANMLFVDASTDRVGIGTSTPSKTLEVNGEVKIATVTTTPTSLLGKDGSNVVGEVTSVAQMGIMKAGGTTTNTSSVGIITVAHGLPYTPSQVLVTLAQQSSYVIVCHSITSSNMLFTVYDSTTGLALDNVSVGFFWLAIK